MTLSSSSAAYPHNRVLPFEGVLNFRDMGGYAAADGRKVKYSLFYRSAELTGMTDRDKELFASLHIKTIFDYRDDSEALRNPDPAFPNITNIRVPVMKQDIPADMRELVRQGYFKSMTAETFADMYVRMAINNESYRQLMAAVMNPDRLGILHHCAAGRDRTGIGAAFILLALGVPKETVIEDYLISNETLVPMNEKIKKQLAEFLSAEEIADITAKLELRREFLEAVFTAIEDKYGTVDAFLEQEFGLTAERRAALQSCCLE